MKMKVEVNEQNKLIIDVNEVEIDKLDSEMLEKMLDNGLADNVEFSLPEDTSHPVATLIKEMENLVKSDSDFRKNIEEIIKEQKENDLKLEAAENDKERLSDNDLS